MNQGCGERLARADALSDRYGKPLEAEHWGEFVAITEDGRTVLGPTLLEVAQRADAEFGAHVFAHLFKVGNRDVGRIR